FCRPLTRNCAKHASQRVTGTHLTVSKSSDEVNMRIRKVLNEKLEQEQTRLIGPVQIINEEKQGTPARQFAKQHAHRIEQPEARFDAVEICPSFYRPGVREVGRDPCEMLHY